MDPFGRFWTARLDDPTIRRQDRLGIDQRQLGWLLHPAVASNAMRDRDRPDVTIEKDLAGSSLIGR